MLSGYSDYVNAENWKKATEIQQKMYESVYAYLAHQFGRDEVANIFNMVYPGNFLTAAGMIFKMTHEQLELLKLQVKLNGR